MIVEKLLVGLSVLSVAAVADPGYNSLSEAIMSSMTNLWNEKQASQSIASDESQPDFLDMFEDEDSENISTDDNTMTIYSENAPSSYSPPNIVQQKSDYIQYPSRRKPLLGRRVVRPSPHPNATNKNFVKSVKKDPGPLYRALYNSHPLSFEHLLHYYDYLDESSSDESCSKDTPPPPSQNKPHIGEAIESLLSKFISKLTGLMDRPVVVHANVCCSSPSTDLMAIHNVTEAPLQTPHYIGTIPPTDRYAADQVDIVKQMKEQYDKVIRLMSLVNHANENTGDKVESPVEPNIVTASVPEEIPFVSTSANASPPLTVVETSTTEIIDTTSYAPVGLDTSSSTFIGEDITTASTLLPPSFEQGAEIETNPKDAVENITIEEVLKELTTELPVELTTEQILSEDAMTEINPPVEENSVIPSTEISANASPLKRKRRDTRSKKQRRTTEKVPSTNTADPTTEHTVVQEINYDEFVKNVLGNKTSLLETLIMNRDPIVEHIHANLLDRELKLGKEWQRPSQPDCEDSSSASVTSSPIDSEELIFNPPDFIESVDVKTKTKLEKRA